MGDHAPPHAEKKDTSSPAPISAQQTATMIISAGLLPLSVRGRMRDMLKIQVAPNKGVNAILLIFGALLFIGNVSRAQADKRKPELFTNYVSAATPPAKAYIPAETCRAIVTQADRIVTSDELRTLGKGDLQVASLNLRICATSELARLDRDLAVGLYGEVISEIERRERATP